MPKIVVDTNYFINNPAELRHLAQTHSLFVTPNVLKEINDPTTTNLIRTTFPDLKKQTPDAEHTKAVARFAKKTGDFTSLSIVDMELIALARQLITENAKTEHLRKTPKKRVNQQGGKKPKEDTLGWGGGWGSDDEEGWVGEDDAGEHEGAA